MNANFEQNSSKLVRRNLYQKCASRLSLVTPHCYDITTQMDVEGHSEHAV